MLILYTVYTSSCICSQTFNNFITVYILLDFVIYEFELCLLWTSTTNTYIRKEWGIFARNYIQEEEEEAIPEKKYINKKITSRF